MSAVFSGILPAASQQEATNDSQLLTRRMALRYLYCFIFKFKKSDRSREGMGGCCFLSKEGVFFSSGFYFMTDCNEAIYESLD